MLTKNTARTHCMKGVPRTAGLCSRIKRAWKVGWVKHKVEDWWGRRLCAEDWPAASWENIPKRSKLNWCIQQVGPQKQGFLSAAFYLNNRHRTRFGSTQLAIKKKYSNRVGPDLTWSYAEDLAMNNRYIHTYIAN